MSRRPASRPASGPCRSRSVTLSITPDLASGALASSPADLTACDREPIHVPGAIQPHGLMLIADAATMAVIGGAGEIDDRLTPVWLDRPLDALLAQPLADAILASGRNDAPVPLELVPGRAEAFDALLHIVGDRIVVELEPAPDAPPTAAGMLAELDAAGASFERAADLQALCENAATIFRKLTGFDRVMVYRFLDDGAGTVLAEDRDPALGSFLNHHFPATDIPQQARALYVRNRVRVIPDAAYVPAILHPAEAGLDAVDLSDSVLRSVSPIHIQYLHNMGVAASASVSIVKDGLLWGLIACHHNSPRAMPYVVRQAARALAGGLARQIRAREEAEMYRDRIRLRGGEDAILARLDQDTTPGDSLAEVGEPLRRMLGADGFALVRGPAIDCAGRCPADAQIFSLAGWAAQRAAVESFATHRLPIDYPAAAGFADVASGLMAMTLPGETVTVLLWFRAEQPQMIEWAGNPHKAATGPIDALSPRASFAAWREEVRGLARPWTLADVEAVGRLRRTLIDARQRYRLRELNREMGAILAEQDALIAQKDHLLREVNHRVQNSLQLVNSFLGMQARQAGDGDAAHVLEEAQRRVSAVGLVHRRLYQDDRIDTVDLARYLEDLIGELSGTMGDDWARALTLDLAPILLSADRAVQVGLVLTELVINAQKYAYGGASGPIAISLEPYRNQFRLIVADRGVGRTRDRQGFGSRMMKAMVAGMGGTIEESSNHPGLRIIVTAPAA